MKTAFWRKKIKYLPLCAVPVKICINIKKKLKYIYFNPKKSF